MKTIAIMTLAIVGRATCESVVVSARAQLLRRRLRLLRRVGVSALAHLTGTPTAKLGLQAIFSPASGGANSCTKVGQ